MPITPTVWHRSVRLQGYDYNLPGAYFITICTFDRLPLLGDVVNGELHLYRCGGIVQDCWRAIGDHFPNAGLDAFVVMPNHVHGVLWLKGATQALPSRPRRPAGPPPGSVGAIVGAFKSGASKTINVLRHRPGSAVWQRNYYERVIRDDRELNNIRTYIQENPARWQDDENNPANIPS